MSKLPDIPLEITHRVRDHCLCLHTQRAARALSRRFDAAFRPLGIKSGQFSLLISLNRPKPPTLGSVAALLGMDRTTLTANLKPLEQRGLLTVIPDEQDRRSRRLVLTEPGRTLLREAVPIWERMHAEAEADLAGEAQQMRAGLAALGSGA